MREERVGNGLADTEGRRLELLREIGAKRNSIVVAYLTTTRPGVNAPDLSGGHSAVDSDDIQVIEGHLREARLHGVRNIDLFLMTYGGDSTVPWGLVAMIREYLKEGSFRVIVPVDAYSAGSSICLGADEIVMGPGSVLGPVDSGFYWNGGARLRYASASDLQGFWDLLESLKIGGRARGEKALGWLTGRMDGLAVGAFYRAWKENHRKIMKLLESRRPALMRSQNERIARFMLYEIGNHGQSIRRTEARANGLSFITDLERTGLESQISELFNLYADILKIRTPFARPSKTLADLEQVGDEADYDVSGVHISETPVAIVESEYDTNPAFVAYGLRHWGQAPPIPEPEHTEPGGGKRILLPLEPKKDSEPAAFWVSSRTPQRIWKTPKKG